MIRTPRIDQLFLVGFIIKVVHQAYGHPEKFFLVHTRPKHGLSWISESRGHPTDNQSAVAKPLLVAIAVVVGVGFGGGCRVGGLFLAALTAGGAQARRERDIIHMRK